MKDFIWGIAVRAVNRLQEFGILNAKTRDLFRKFGHILISAPRERVLEMKFGFKIKTPKGHKGSRSYATGTYEERLSDFLYQEIQENEKFVDVGAFIGFYTCLAAKKVGTKGHVWAFEPEESARKLLNYNVTINNYANVTTVGSAIGDKDGIVSFANSSDLGIGPAGGFVVGGSSHKNHTVSIQKLDSFFKVTPDIAIDWIKLDTDGHELQALDGLVSLANRSPDMKLILEVDPSHFGSTEHINKLYKKLVCLGFQKGIIAERNFEEISLSDSPFVSDHNVNVIFTKN